MFFFFVEENIVKWQGSWLVTFSCKGAVVHQFYVNASKVMQIPACSCMNNYLDLLSSHLSLSLSSFFFSSEDQSGPECRSSCCRRRALLNNTLIIYRNRKVSLKRSQSNENYDITYCLFSSKRRGKFNLCCSLFFKRRHFVSSRNAGANCKFRNTTRKISEFEVFARSRKRERERDVSVFSGLNSEKLIISGKMKHQRKHAQNQPRFTF